MIIWVFQHYLSKLCIHPVSHTFSFFIILKKLFIRGHHLLRILNCQAIHCDLLISKTRHNMHFTAYLIQLNLTHISYQKPPVSPNTISIKQPPFFMTFLLPLYSFFFPCQYPLFPHMSPITIILALRPPRKKKPPAYKIR